MTSVYAVTLTDEARDDLHRLETFGIEHELTSETPDWTTPERALEAIRTGMSILSWSPLSCRKAELGNGRSRELIMPFGETGYVVLFEVSGQQVFVGAIRHQREDDYSH